MITNTRVIIEAIKGKKETIGGTIVVFVVGMNL
jgi:hypothetical protein